MQRLRHLCVIMGLFITFLCPCWAHAQDAECSVWIPIDVKVYGDTTSVGDSFKVDLFADDSKTPMPENTTCRIEGEGSAAFGPIQYKLPGDYEYVIRQEKERDSGWNYDETVYKVTVRVINDGQGGFKAELWARSDQTLKKSSQILFKNAFTHTKPLTHTPKTGDGMHPMLWFGVGFISWMIMVLCVRLWKGKRYI